MTAIHPPCSRPKNGRIAGFTLAMLGAAVATSAVLGQAVDGKVTKNDPPPPVTYHGLIPGLSSAQEVREKLGAPMHEAKWYAWKMLYPAKGRPGLIDSIHLHDAKGTFACVEAASIPEGYQTAKDVQEKLGEPEYELLMNSFSMLDYTAKGSRWVFDSNGNTIGVAFVPHTRPRVHSGGRHRMDLRRGPTLSADAARTPDLAGLKAGASQVDITPKKEWIDPRYQKNFRVHDPLYSRCAVFQNSKATIAIVGADLFGFGYQEIQVIRENLKKQGVDFTVVASSHDHAAPDTLGVYGHYPKEYVAFLQKTIEQGVLEAKARLRPVREFKAASRELPMDGARVIGLIRNARNPGIVDPTLNVLQAIGEDGKPITTIVNFACHVEGIEEGVRDLSADFPAPLCDQIQKDGGGQAVFLNGALGGMVSGDNKARTHSEATASGLEFARLTKELLGEARSPKSFSMSYDSRRVEIPVTNLVYKPLLKARGRLTRGRVITEVSLITLGEAQLITLPGELLPEASFEILEKMSGSPRILIGLANDQLGYMIPPSDFRDDEYEETASAGPGAAPEIIGAAHRLLGGVK